MQDSGRLAFITRHAQHPASGGAFARWRLAERLSLALRLIALALLLTRTCFAGEVPTTEPDFKGDGLCQFALHGFALTAQSEASINQAVEKLIAKHELAFGFKRSPEFRLRMRVYNRFADFTNSTAMRGLTNLQGVYVSRTKEIVTFRQEIPGFLGTTLLHEASHAIMDHHYRRIQTWLSEGAAEYFAYVLAPSALTTSFLQQRGARLNLWLREDKLPSLEELLNASHPKWMQLNPEQAYAMSWSLVQFLMSSDTNRQVMNTMLLEWQGDRRRAPDCAGQVERLYHGGLKGFETAWHRWLDPAGAVALDKAAFRGHGLCQFVTQGYDLTAAMEATINQQAKDLLERQCVFFGLARTPDFHLRIRIFGEMQGYARFSANWRVLGTEIKPAELAHVAGYYAPFSREIVALAAASPEELTQLLLQLANTAILEEHFRRVPRWVILGSPHHFITTGGSTGQAGEALTQAWQRFRTQSGRLSLRSILDDSSNPADSQSLDSGNQRILLCWSLFEFFSSSEQNRQVLKTVLQDPQGGGSGSLARMERNYHGGVTRLEADFREWTAKLAR